MQKIIADASTVILLAKVTLLRGLAEEMEVTLTPKVKAEALRKNEFEDAQIISKLLDEKIITESEGIEFEKFAEDFGLGIGEAESLAVAYREKRVLATDDWRAIKGCKVLGVRFITAIHCLIYLVKKGKLDHKIAYAKLKNLEKYGRYNADIIKDAKSIIEGENHD